MLCQYESNPTLSLLFWSFSSITASDRDQGMRQSNKTGKFEAFLLGHTADNMVKKWRRLHLQRVRFSKVSGSHMSLKVNFSSCSHDSGILFSKTLVCDLRKHKDLSGFHMLTLLCQQKNIFNTIYSEIAMLPQPI